jgi:hypothetical protein
MNNPRVSGGPVSLENWSRPGAGSAEEVPPPEEAKPVIKCPKCGAEFELKELETEVPEVPAEGAAA